MEQARRLLLDTDVLSAIMRNNPAALKRARTYLFEHDCFSLSIISRYEILRGLRSTNSTRQSAFFERFCKENHVVPLTDPAVVKAAEIYADLRSRGELIGDADILMAASALVSDYGVATNNEDHFRRVPGLHVENWLK